MATGKGMGRSNGVLILAFILAVGLEATIEYDQTIPYFLLAGNRLLILLCTLYVFISYRICSISMVSFDLGLP